LSPSRKIELFPLKFDKGGEASTWLVTGADITSFDRVTILDPGGEVLATARVARL
jgi:hypothetical protein